MTDEPRAEDRSAESADPDGEAAPDPDLDPEEPGTTAGDRDARTTPADAETDATLTDETPELEDPFADAADPDVFYDALETLDQPVATPARYARTRDLSQAEAIDELQALTAAGEAEQLTVPDDAVWYPTEWTQLVDRERLVVFPDRHEIVADQPSQFTRARLSQFARLADTTGDGAYRYEIRPEDIWQAPYDSLADLLETVRGTLPDRYPGLETWIESQHDRASQFRLYTHEDGYTVLAAASADAMGNVARQTLDEQLRGPISETESWVAEGQIAQLKRLLYEAGYPVQDRRDLDTGETLAFDVEPELRPYQQAWVEGFFETGSGVLVGPPGSGKTVTALAVAAAVGGETLILVPGRELATQWREELLAHTTLTADQIGEYHGGEKRIAPVTIATYQTAGMDRHRQLFDSRRWGLIVYEECHHVPSTVFRRSTSLQTSHRLGLTSTPVRESDDEEEIFTLIGPPIGTDWEALFEAGYVAEPVVELRYVPWADAARDEYVGSDGARRRQVAATNPAKVEEVTRLLQTTQGQALIFVEYLEQGQAIADAIGVPFVSGQTPHARREALFEQFRTETLPALVVSRVGDEGIDLPGAEVAIVASGLGGSRRQGAQRAGRTMRPTGQARMFVLATQGTREEEFARNRMRYLAEKGVRVTERTVGEDNPF